MNTIEPDLVRQLRYIGNAEGFSYLFLLFIAMPVKYAMGIPELVKYTGWAHGVLFVLFGLAVLRVKLTLDFSFKWSVWAMFLSLIPFGTFLLDRQLKRMYTPE